MGLPMHDWRLNRPRLTTLPPGRFGLVISALLVGLVVLTFLTTGSVARAEDAAVRMLEFWVGMAIFLAPSYVSVGWVNADGDALSTLDASIGPLHATNVEPLKIALDELRLGADRLAKAIDRVEQTAAVVPGVIALGASLVVGHVAMASLSDDRAILALWALAATVVAGWAAIECMARHRPPLTPTIPAILSVDAELLDYYAALARASAVALDASLSAFAMKRFNLISSWVMLGVAAALLLAFAAVGGIK